MFIYYIPQQTPTGRNHKLNLLAPKMKKYI